MQGNLTLWKYRNVESIIFLEIFCKNLPKKSNKKLHLEENENGAPQIAFIWIQGRERSLPKLPLQTIVVFAQTFR